MENTDQINTADDQAEITEQLILLDDVEKYAKDLSEYEVMFVDEASKQLGEDMPLSSRQHAILRKIYEERV